MENIESHLVKLRKDRKCWGCARKFPIGANLMRANKESGEITTAYFCAVCSEWFCRYDDGEGVEFGVLRDDEDWIKIKKELELKP